jgi:DNA polymerase III epsilon subunit-like protein
MDAQHGGFHQYKNKENNMKRRYLSIDTETGGLGLDKSLLTVGLILLDEELNEIDNRNYLIKPNNGIYNIEARALGINGINLIEHDKMAKTEKEVGTDLYTTLYEWSEGHKNKVIPLGKQVDGDINQIWDKLISRSSWEMSVSYRRIEVSSVMLFLQDIGQLPTFKGSLKDCAEYYKIDSSNLHDALFDARLTAEVYKRMLKDLKNGLSRNTED